MTGEWDDLFNTDQGGRSWLTNRTGDELEWLESVAEEAVAHGQQPVWKKVHDAYAEKFGAGRAPKAASTISLHMRRLIEDKRGA